jgi:hypothetical protein
VSVADNACLVDDERTRQLIGIADHLADAVAQQRLQAGRPQRRPGDRSQAPAGQAVGPIRHPRGVGQAAERQLETCPKLGSLLRCAHRHQGDLTSGAPEPGIVLLHADRVLAAQRSAQVANEQQRQGALVPERREADPLAGVIAQFHVGGRRADLWFHRGRFLPHSFCSFHPHATTGVPRNAPLPVRYRT